VKSVLPSSNGEAEARAAEALQQGVACGVSTGSMPMGQRDLTRDLPSGNLT